MSADMKLALQNNIKNRLRAISIRQPYAEAILRGEKVVEYRTRNTNVRGKVFIYAGSKILNNEIFEEYRVLKSGIIFGAIIGTVEIMDSVKSTKFPGWYDWILINPQRLEKSLKPTNQPQPVFWYPQF